MNALSDSKAGPHWTEDYRLLVLRDPMEEPARQFLAVLLERNVVGHGASIAEALQDVQEQLATDYAFQLSESLARPQDDPDPELLACFRNRKARVTADGEEVLLRLRARVIVRFRNVSQDKLAAPEPQFEFAASAVG